MVAPVLVKLSGVPSTIPPTIKLPPWVLIVTSAFKTISLPAYRFIFSESAVPTLPSVIPIVLPGVEALNIMSFTAFKYFQYLFHHNLN